MFTMDEDLSHMHECLQEMKTCLKIFPLKSSLAVQTLGHIIYHYLGQSLTKCCKLFLESSEIVCETGQSPLSHPFRLCTAHAQGVKLTHRLLQPGT